MLGQGHHPRVVGSAFGVRTVGVGLVALALIGAQAVAVPDEDPELFSRPDQVITSDDPPDDALDTGHAPGLTGFAASTVGSALAPAELGVEPAEPEERPPLAGLESPGNLLPLRE
jgi:hypothetical protein